MGDRAGGVSRVAAFVAGLVMIATAAEAQERVAVHGWLAAHLPRYRELAAKPWPGPLPDVTKLSPGDSYPGTHALAEILRDLGDLPAGVAPAGTTYGGALVEAVTAFQARHGLATDGVIGAATLGALNQPYTKRLEQIEASLRWLETIAVPEDDAIVVVNIPAFTLYAWTGADRGKAASLTMPVVVGKTRSATPVLGSEIAHVVFRPYWYVPRGITTREMLPAHEKNPSYFDEHDMELTASGDDNAPGLAATPENVALLREGKLSLRQRPGPNNALGKVKFIFPNDHSVYLHDTPAKSFFERDRRDFSHGCVRVGNPAALAELLLRDVPGWDRARIDAAMEAERPEVVLLRPTVPVWLVYTTAVAGADGTLAFYDDVYMRGEPSGGTTR